MARYKGVHQPPTFTGREYFQILLNNVFEIVADLRESIKRESFAPFS